MPRAYRQLNLDERRTIFRLLNAKVPVAAIAQQLGRHRSTLHREISRNHFHEQREYAGYVPMIAHDLAGRRRRRLKKLSQNDCLRRYVIDGLERCWSPQQIAGRLRLDQEHGATVCHETIYQYIYGPEGRDAALHRHLPTSRRRRRTRYGRKPRSSFVPADRSIQRRPAEVEDRRSFGHWEANLTSMIERQTRYAVLLPNPDRQSTALIKRIGHAWQGLPEGSCRTITFDRGTEFAAYALLAQTSGAAAYFCDPHSPWQKGAIENTNGRIRRFLPGERNLAELAEDEIQRITAMLNATPRRCLGYQTPNEAFGDQLAALTHAAQPAPRPCRTSPGNGRAKLECHP